MKAKGWFDIRGKKLHLQEEYGVGNRLKKKRQIPPILGLMVKSWVRFDGRGEGHS
jgi:hypothetical protein